jgi:hypothetical protein
MWKRNIYGSATLTAFFNTPNFSLSVVLTSWFLAGIEKVSLKKNFLSHISVLWILATRISDLAIKSIKKGPILTSFPQK